MRKFLFIGVGGSGGATLRFLRKSIADRLAVAGYDGPFPEAWQFIQLDLPPNDDKLGGRLPETLGSAYRGVAPVGVEFDQHRRTLAARGGGAPLENLSTWWPDPNSAPRHVWFGAGQYRAVGRVVTLNQIDQVHNAINASLNAMSLDSSVTQLREAAAALGFETGREEDEPIALVMGSMAGGTGAGAILDVCDTLRIMGKQGSTFLRIPFAVLYTAAVFGNLDTSVVPGVEPNTLAFISEMSAMLKNRDPVMPVYHASAGYTAELTERGPALAFLIGPGNDDVTLPDEVAVFESTAQAITAWVVDPRVQSTLQASPLGNLDQLRKSKSYLPIHQHEPADDQPCSSFGYARLEISRRRFHRYAAERMARHAVEHLVRAHIDRAREGTPADVAIAERATPQRATEFLRACGLSERDRTENQIIDAVLETAESMSSGSQSQQGITLDAACQAEANDLAMRILDAPGAAEKNFNPAQAQQQLQRQVEAKVPEFMERWGSLLSAGVARWCEQIQSRVVTAVTASIAAEGLAVTRELLARADEDLQAAMSELQAESVEISNFGANAFGRMALPPAGKKQKISQSLKPSFTKAGSDRLRSEVEVMRRQLTTDAIRDLRTGFLDPLRQSLQAAERELLEQWPAVQEWVEGDGVPGRFAPAPNVVLLTDIDDYPGEFDRLLAATTGEPKSAALARAVNTALTADDDDDGAVVGTTGISALITCSPWIRSDDRRASFDVNVNAEALRQRSHEWLVSDTSVGVGAYLTEPLQQTMSSASSTAIKHFVSRFRIALERSAPLIDINVATLNEIHKQPKPQYQRVMSAIPLSVNPGDEAFEKVKDLLLAIGVESAEVPSYFHSDGDEAAAGGDIEISTFLRAYHPMVFASLVNPIAAAAQGATGRGDAGFWDMRRTRPLPEFIPVSRSTLRFMIRGWLVGSLLGQISFDQLNQFGHPYVAPAVAMPGGGTVTFPRPGLGRLPSAPRDALAAVLEAYPLAEVMFATGQPNALAGYERLLALGVGSALATWVAAGTTDAGQSPGGDTPDERCEYATKNYRTALDAIEAYDDEFRPDADRWALPPRSWELRHLVGEVLHELIDTAAAARVSGDSGSGVVHI